MEVEINMINVEDGDAIILMLKDVDRKALILIDGGYKKYYPRLKKRLEQILPEFDNKIALIICSHYDNDHLGGVEKIIDDYHSIIQKIWIHKISNTIDEQIKLIQYKILFLSKTLLLESDKHIKSMEATENNLIIEGYKDLLKVIKKISDYGLEENICEATRDTSLEGFPEFKVISPTAKYYNENLDDLKNESILEDLKENLINKSKCMPTLKYLFYEGKIEKGEYENPCNYLKSSSLENNVTATNMVSIVTLLIANNKKYLFTGDAGIETFIEHTPNWDNELRDLFFLDIAHHGSENNTSRSMLEVFNPEIAFVSAKNATNRPSEFIKKCTKLKPRNRIFEITNYDPNTWYLVLDKDGNVNRKLLS